MQCYYRCEYISIMHAHTHTHTHTHAHAHTRPHTHTPTHTHAHTRHTHMCTHAHGTHTHSERATKTIFPQIAQQILQKPVVELRCSSRAWKVSLIGEGADDAGGVFDETMAQMCEVRDYALLINEVNEDVGLSSEPMWGRRVNTIHR